MNIEYEATFPDIEKEEMRLILEKSGATLIRPEFLQKRVVFALPTGHEITGGWARVRNEGNKITMSLKIVDGDKIENQREICLTVDSFEQAELFLTTIGCRKKSYQETKRELWMMGDTEITIDEWPFLRPFLEIEGKSEEVVKQVTEKLGLDYREALFGAVDIIYIHQYPHLTFDRINKTPRIVFEGENPFL
ncbi:MAG: CYTH domain-containing protein [Candidatus Moranbacteria bacterium]|nr:CYTH domain-containing protein [Candidatus Moranbacteria bacterium]MDD3964848.1 CYTH domain-containing protein [Candidatus Moranbacteria bacterium]